MISLKQVWWKLLIMSAHLKIKKLKKNAEQSLVISKENVTDHISRISSNNNNYSSGSNSNSNSSSSSRPSDNVNNDCSLNDVKSRKRKRNESQWKRNLKKKLILVKNI